MPSGVHGAEKRIRTSGKFLTYTRFPIVLLKPLGHLCKDNHYFTRKTQKLQLFSMKFSDIFSPIAAFLFSLARSAENKFPKNSLQRDFFGI